MPTLPERSERLSAAFLAGVVLLVTVNAVLAYHAEQVLVTSEQWVSHTWEVMEHLQSFLGDMEEAESGTRGYVLTHDEAYLEPHASALLTYAGELNEVQRLTVDKAEQQQRVNAMRLEAARRMRILDGEIAMERAGDHEGALRLVHSGLGLSAMSNLRGLAATTQQFEQGLLQQRTARVRSAQLEARGTVLFASVLDVLFAVWAYFSIARERRLRQQATRSHQELEKLQAISDVALSRQSVAELTQSLLHRLRTVAEADWVALFDWLGDSVAMVDAVGVELPAHEPMRVRPEGPFARAVATNGVVQLTGAEVNQAPLAVMRASGALLFVPLSPAGQVSAVLVAARNNARAFDREERTLLTLVADRIATSIDRANAYEAEQQARRRAEASEAEVRELNAELEERVRLRTLELEGTNRELEAFSYSVSHDLRAPLRTVDGFSVALEEDYGDLLKDEGRHYLHRIRNGVQRMGSLIDALLQLSRITRAELSVEFVDLSALAAEVARGLDEAHPERAIEWSIEPGLTASGDPRLLRAVFENMMGNAVKFTARVPVARIAFGQQGGAYFVRDNGAGFDQTYASKLFVAFQRLHGDKDFAGSGIGLATVARVVRRHHGRMWAEGAIGQGATFWFTLETGAP